MRTKRKIYVSAAMLALALTGVSGATAQPSGNPDSALVNYQAALEAAFSPGYWEGRFEERDEAGKITDVDDKPSCIGAGEGGGFAATMIEAIEVLKSVGSCKSTGGGANSLNYQLVCTPQSGQSIEYTSTGSFTQGKDTDLTVAMGPIGRTKSMHVTMKRISATCPK